MNTRTEHWHGYSIRFVEQDGEWWAVLKDICDALHLRTELTCINGQTVIYDGTNVDNDIRFGCIAWGIHIPE